MIRSNFRACDLKNEELVELLLLQVTPPPVPDWFRIAEEPPIPEVSRPVLKTTLLDEGAQTDLDWLFGSSELPESEDQMLTEVGKMYYRKIMAYRRECVERTNRHAIDRMAAWHIEYAQALTRAAYKKRLVGAA